MTSSGTDPRGTADRTKIIRRFAVLLTVDLGESLKKKLYSAPIARLLGAELAAKPVQWLCDLWLDGIPVELTKSYKVIYWRNILRPLRAVDEGGSRLWFAFFAYDRDSKELEAIFLLPVSDVLKLTAIGQRLGRDLVRFWRRTEKNRKLEKKGVLRFPLGDIELHRTFYRRHLMAAVLNVDGQFSGLSTLLVRKAFLPRLDRTAPPGENIIVFDDETLTWEPGLPAEIDDGDSELPAAA
jgi:hypothetical protein